MKISKETPLLERLLLRRKIKKCPDKTLKPCWLFTGATNKKGYGNIRFTRQGVGYSMLTHRLSYTLNKGPIPEGLELDHLCTVRSCFNPDHLEATTHLMNVSRGKAGSHNALKTHCIRGHEYSEDNTVWVFYHNRLNKRACLICKRKNDNAYSARKRAKLAEQEI